MPPWRLVVRRRSSRVFQKKCAVPPSRLVVEMSFFFFFVFSGVVLGPTGVVHLRTLRGRTCNLRYYALPESHVTDDVTCDGKFWNMGVVCCRGDW